MEFALVFVLGAVIGSFLNVCIYRMPLGRSVVAPRSYCPFCEKQIGWFDNVPLLSYLVLRGKCRRCGRPIPVRYFLVELISALSGVVLLCYFPLGPSFFVYWLFTFMLITVVGIDIEHQEIPDLISIPGMCLGVALMTVFRIDGSSSHLAALVNSVLGVLAGGCSMFIMGFVGELIFRKEALGGGDVKLMAMIGAFIGWKLAFLAFFMAPILGAGVGIFMKIRFRKEVIAYGPYLSLAAFISLLYGDRIIRYLFWF